MCSSIVNGGPGTCIDGSGVGGQFAGEDLPDRIRGTQANVNTPVDTKSAKQHIRNLIKKNIKESNSHLLLEYPTLTVGEANDWCQANCWSSGKGCTIKPVTFIFSDGSSLPGYDSECSEKVTGTVMKAPEELEKGRGTGIVNKPDTSPTMMRR
jgi:hypothetical protein